MAEQRVGHLAQGTDDRTEAAAFEQPAAAAGIPRAAGAAEHRIEFARGTNGDEAAERAQGGGTDKKWQAWGRQRWMSLI